MRVPKRIEALQKRLAGDYHSAYKGVLSSYVVSNRHAFSDPEYLLGNIRAGKWKDLFVWADSISATEYSEATRYFVENQFSALIKKYPFTPEELPEFNPDAQAQIDFLRSEYRCKWVNRRFSIGQTKSIEKHSWLLHSVRKRIEAILGVIPDMDKIRALCDFGPGSSVGVHGNATNIGRKLLSTTWTVTPRALPLAIDALWSNDHLRELVLLQDGFPCYDPLRFRELVMARIKLVNHNKIIFVPKTAKTSRSIAVEPLLNGFLQKGVDEYMRRRLRRFGIDLRYQKPNQLMALRGTLGGSNPFVTIDLKSASDSMSSELVKDLLPYDWWWLLSCLRSPEYELNGAVHRYEKFVSMGNGFCFPLETLIFSSIVHACNEVNAMPGDYRVYGDDIVCRQSVGLQCLELLRYCGFRHNGKKTFLFGPFRESCGEDFFEGQPVRAVYLDEKLCSLQSLHVLHNSSLRNETSRITWEETREYIRNLVPQNSRLFQLEQRGNVVEWLAPPRDLFMHPVKRVYREFQEGAFTVDHDLYMSGAYIKWNRDQQRWEGLVLSSSPKADRIHHPLARYVEFIAVLRGSKSSAPLSLRRTTRTTARYY